MFCVNPLKQPIQRLYFLQVPCSLKIIIIIASSVHFYFGIFLFPIDVMHLVFSV